MMNRWSLVFLALAASCSSANNEPSDIGVADMAAIPDAAADAATNPDSSTEPDTPAASMCGTGGPTTDPLTVQWGDPVGDVEYSTIFSCPGEIHRTSNAFNFGMDAADGGRLLVTFNLEYDETYRTWGALEGHSVMGADVLDASVALQGLGLLEATGDNIGFELTEIRETGFTGCLFGFDGFTNGTVTLTPGVIRVACDQ